MADITPEMIAAAWATWHSRHGGKLGPGPAFIEAITAAINVSPLLSRIEELEKALEPFVPIVDAILSEAPADADYYSLFMDCEGNSHRIKLDQLRAARSLIPEKKEAR